jgi:hypothetical protein
MSYSMTPTRAGSDMMGGGLGIGRTLLSSYMDGLRYMRELEKLRMEQQLDQFRLPSQAAGFDASLAQNQGDAYRSRLGTYKDWAEAQLTRKKQEEQQGEMPESRKVLGISPFANGGYYLQGPAQQSSDAALLAPTRPRTPYDYQDVNGLY